MERKTDGPHLIQTDKKGMRWAEETKFFTTTVLLDSSPFILPESCPKKGKDGQHLIATLPYDNMNKLANNQLSS